MTSLLLLTIPISCYIIGETPSGFYFLMHETVLRTIVRISWNLQPFQFYAEALFLTSLIKQNYQLETVEKRILSVLFALGLFPLLLLFFSNNVENNILHLFLTIFCKVTMTKRFILKIGCHTFLLAHILFTWQILKNDVVPYVLKLQLKIFLLLMCLPLIPDTILAFIDLFNLQANSNIHQLLDLLSMALFSFALLFFAQRIYALRFLNMTDHVEAGEVSSLTEEELIRIKQQLCNTKNLMLFDQINVSFFNQLAHISSQRIMFYTRHPEQQIMSLEIAQKIEYFLEEKPAVAAQFFIEDSVLVYDELAFTHFYNYSEERAQLLQFLHEINAAVCIPLKHMEQFFGAIIITKNQEKEELFSKSVQLHMQLYGTFVTYALSRLERASYYTLLEKHTAVSHELFQTQQKNMHFHEAMTSILTSSASKKHGVLLYKNGVFSCMNTIAEELLQINPNAHQGHPLTKALKELVRRVQTYGAAESIIEKNNTEINLCFQAFPSKDKELFVLVSIADITQMVPIERALLQPTEIEFAVFLQTTKPGKAIDHAFPGNGIIMYQSKLQMIKTFNSKKIMFLDAAEDDLETLLDLAKNVCLKTTVHTIDCATTSGDEIITSLFGKHLFVEGRNKIQQGLFYALDQTGIIHLANAHYLDVKTQELLIRFLKTGSFFVYNSPISQTADVTIVLSAPIHIAEIAKQGLLLDDLCNYLHDGVICLPDLSRLPRAELETVACALQRQLISTPEYYHLFGFSSTELQQLDEHRPESFFQLRRRINPLTKQRITESPLLQQASINAVKTGPYDDIILEAARRGKQALKDRQLMKALWEKLKSQIRIAELLDVDRSSVHRRLKEYGVILSVTE